MRWQKLMDEAYDRWQNGEFTSHEDMCNKVDQIHRDAIYLGNLHYQVCNGGFQQWVDNGYGLNARETIEALEKVGTPNAKNTIDLIEGLEPYIDINQKNEGFFQNYWIEEFDEYDDYGYENAEHIQYCEEISDQYFEYSEELAKEIENYFTPVVDYQI